MLYFSRFSTMIEAKEKCEKSLFTQRVYLAIQYIVPAAPQGLWEKGRLTCLRNATNIGTDIAKSATAFPTAGNTEK